MAITGMLNGAMASLGFLAGYLWAVEAWAARFEAIRGTLLRSAVLPGVAIAALYGIGLLVIFRPLLAPRGEGGFRAAVAPASFSFSVLLAAAGTRAALVLVGG